MKPSTITMAFRKSGTWPVDCRAIEFVRAHLEDVARRENSTPSPPAQSILEAFPTSNLLPRTPDRSRQALIKISKEVEDKENVQPREDADLTTSSTLVHAMRRQLEKENVSRAHHEVRKDQLQQNNFNSETEPGDRIRLRNPDHLGQVFAQDDAQRMGKLKRDVFEKKQRGRGGKRSGGKRKAMGRAEDVDEAEFGTEGGGSRGVRERGRGRGGAKGKGKGRAVSTESDRSPSPDPSSDDGEPEMEVERAMAESPAAKRAKTEKVKPSWFYEYYLVDEEMEEAGTRSDEGERAIREEEEGLLGAGGRRLRARKV